MSLASSILERPVYGFTQVDSLLRLRAGTARRWIDGYDRGGRHYEPVVRVQTTGDTSVTWGEFVETHLLAQFRTADVSMRRMRPVVERLRERYGIYPLARARAYVLDRQLVHDVQEEVGLPKGLALVEVLASGQLRLTPPARAFFATSEFTEVGVPVMSTQGADASVGAELDGDIDPQAVVLRLAPLGRANAVRLDPEYGFGEPTVRGRNVRTDVLAEAVRAGDSIASVANGWSLTIEEVNAAVEYEERRAAA
jgi:uncharacterized protein (DUF433 family)